MERRRERPLQRHFQGPRQADQTTVAFVRSSCSVKRWPIASSYVSSDYCLWGQQTSFVWGGTMLCQYAPKTSLSSGRLLASAIAWRRRLYSSHQLASRTGLNLSYRLGPNIISRSMRVEALFITHRPFENGNVSS